MANGFEPSQLQQVGTALQSFGAGIQGQGPQFQAQQNQAQALQQQQAKQQQTDEKERAKSVFLDAENALSFAKEGKFDTVLQLGIARLKNLQTLGSQDPRDTQRITQLANAANQGDEEAGRLLVDELQGVVDVGQVQGILKRPEEDSKVRAFQPITLINPETGEKRLFSPTTTESGEAALSEFDLPEGFEVSRETASEKRSAELAAGIKKSSIKRSQTRINEGIEAVKGIPLLRRGLALLERVETGGFDAAALRARQLFGIEGADEGELTANLGKAVLAQLKPLFGAAFTKEEGDRLIGISAGFNKSPANNKRLLRQALLVFQNAADRGLSSAKKLGDIDSQQDILDFTEGKFDLTDEKLSAIFNPTAQGSPVEAQAQALTITSQAEFDALPSDAEFIEDGVRRRKN